VDEARTQAQARNRMGAVEATLMFHETLVRIANKRQTAIMLNILHNQVRLLENMRQMRAPRTHPQQRERIAAYEKLLVLIESKDITAAQTLLRDHIHAERDALLLILSGSEA
jgi:DNA-binding GntR family transcriptional regulator